MEGEVMSSAQRSDDGMSELFDSDQPHFRELMAGFPSIARTATEHPEDFWERQRREIRKRIASQGRQPWWEAKPLAAAFALLLLAVTMLQNGSAPPVNRSDLDSDQELYLAVEQAVLSNGPDALAPAAMLANEIVSSDRTYKENQNENQ
jgi:hypothetical protein